MDTKDTKESPIFPTFVSLVSFVFNATSATKISNPLYRPVVSTTFSARSCAALANVS
jgi:hypothetical protein